MQARTQDEIKIFPFLLDEGVVDGTQLGAILNKFNFLASTEPKQQGEEVTSKICRDLTQGFAQLVSKSKTDWLKVFISHTKQSGTDDDDIKNLLDLVRKAVENTRLQKYIDSNDIQPSVDWAEDLIKNAKTSAMLSIRTDLYSSRE